MITRRLPLAAAVAAGAVAAVACGGSSPHPNAAAEAKVKQTVHDALADLASGEGRAFCALTTGAERRRLTAEMPGAGCPAVVRSISADLSDKHRQALLHASVSKVEINGSQAIVHSSDITSPDGALNGYLSDGGKPTTLTRRPDGRWEISG
jgi:hypothetical protein